MNYKERENLISLITTIIVSVPYLSYSVIRFQQENLNSEDQFSYWTTVFLILIPIRILAEIIVSIIFTIIRAIIKQKVESNTVDERDELIDLKSMRSNFFVFVIGFVIAIILAAITKSAYIMILALIITGFLSELVGIAFKIYYYKN